MSQNKFIKITEDDLSLLKNITSIIDENKAIITNMQRNIDILRKLKGEYHENYIFSKINIIRGCVTSIHNNNTNCVIPLIDMLMENKKK